MAPSSDQLRERSRHSLAPPGGGQLAKQSDNSVLGSAFSTYATLALGAVFVMVTGWLGSA